MTRPPGDMARLDKLKANQAAALIQARYRNDRGWAMLLIIGWNVGLAGSALAIFFDWRWLVAGWVVGFGNMFAGIIWFGRIMSKE